MNDEKLKVNSKGNNKILAEGDYFRVCNIARLNSILNNPLELNIENLQLKQGLAIEEKQDDETFIVINNLYYDKDKEEVLLSDVCCRSIDTLKYKEKDIVSYFKRIQEYCNCLEFAKKCLIDIYNKEKENDGYFITSESSDTRIFCYKGFEVEIKDDEYGQQFYFEFNGNEYSCGAFNPYPEEVIKWVIDRYLKENKKNVA